MVNLIPRVDMLKDISDAMKENMQTATNAFAGATISNLRKMMLKRIIQGYVNKSLENVRPDQLRTHIVDHKPTSEVLGEDGYEIPPETIQKIKSVDKFPFIDVKKEIKNFEPVIDKYCGHLVLKAVKEQRPDLFKVINQTPGGQSFIWSDSRKMWRKIKERLYDEL